MVEVPGFSPLDVAGLDQTPLIGPLLLSHQALVYLTAFAAALILFPLKRTRLGLMVRAVGQPPHAAIAMSTGVDRVRFIAVMVCGALSAVGGAFLSTAQLRGSSRT